MFGFVDVNKTEIILAHVYNTKKCFLRILDTKSIFYTLRKFFFFFLMFCSRGRVLFHYVLLFFFITASLKCKLYLYQYTQTHTYIEQSSRCMYLRFQKLILIVYNENECDVCKVFLEISLIFWSFILTLFRFILHMVSFSQKNIQWENATHRETRENLRLVSQMHSSPIYICTHHTYAHGVCVQIYLKKIILDVMKCFRSLDVRSFLL